MRTARVRLPHAWRHCCVGQKRARAKPVTPARRDGGAAPREQPGSDHTALGALRYTLLRDSAGGGGGFVERLLALDDRLFMLCAPAPARAPCLSLRRGARRSWDAFTRREQPVQSRPLEGGGDRIPCRAHPCCMRRTAKAGPCRLLFAQRPVLVGLEQHEARAPRRGAPARLRHAC